MRILVVEPGCRPEVREIDGSLKSMQEIVGGLIQSVPLYDEPAVVLVCNDEGRLLGLPLNRALYEPGSSVPYDIISGTFFLCGAPSNSDHFKSLTDEQIPRCTERFALPEIFLNFNGQIIVVPVKTVD